MNKQMIFYNILFFLLSSIFLSGCIQKENHEEVDGENSASNHVRDAIEENEEEEFDESEQIIIDIYELAKEGKVYDSNWVVGEVNFGQIEEEWGQADRLDQAAEGIYATYDDKKVVFGMDEGGQIYDLRTHSNDIKHVTEAEIIASLGEADEIRYYGNQQISVYKVDDVYQLKFVFSPKEGKKVRYLSHINLLYLPWQPSTRSNYPIREDVTDLVEEMTLEEKIGQLMITGIEGESVDKELQDLIQNNHVGGVILLGRNIVNVEQMLMLINDIKDMNQSRIPLFIGIDEEGGEITRLPKEVIPTPSNREISAANDPSIASELGILLANKLLSLGINLNFAPVMDIDSNPNNPVIGERSYGPDPETVSRFGTKQMQAMKEKGLIPVIKHFPGHGDTSVDSHYELPILTQNKERLFAFELQPFIQAINSGANVVMIGHLLVAAFDEIMPSSLSPSIIRKLLREELGFGGVVMTDDMTMGAILENYEIGEAAVKSIQAGSDLILINHGYENTMRVIDSIKAAVNTGKLTEEQINRSVERILALKKDFSLTDRIVEDVNVNQLNKETEVFLNKLRK